MKYRPAPDQLTRLVDNHVYTVVVSAALDVMQQNPSLILSYMRGIYVFYLLLLVEVPNSLGHKNNHFMQKLNTTRLTNVVRVVYMTCSYVHSQK